MKLYGCKRLRNVDNCLRTDGQTDGQTFGRAYGWTLDGFLQSKNLAQISNKTPKLSSKCLKFIYFFLDTNGINGKYIANTRLMVYLIKVHGVPGQTDGRTHKHKSGDYVSISASGLTKSV